LNYWDQKKFGWSLAPKNILKKLPASFLKEYTATWAKILNRWISRKQKRAPGGKTIPLSPSYEHLLGILFHDSLKKGRALLVRVERSVGEFFLPYVMRKFGSCQGKKIAFKLAEFSSLLNPRLDKNTKVW
jgi:hypothetical protein